MRKAKNWGALALALAMALALAPMMAPEARAEFSGDWTYEKTDGKAVITGYSGSGGIVSIPGSLDGLTVNALDEFIFVGNDTITGAAVPASVTSISPYAFNYCKNLTALTVDSGNPAYMGDGGVLFSKDKKTIVRHPEGKGLLYAIPAGVTKISNRAFYHCQELTDVVIPAGVTKIEEGAFMFCEALKTVTIPGSVTEIGEKVFYECENLTVYC